VGVNGSAGEAEGTHPDPYGLGYAQYPEYIYMYKWSRYPQIYVTWSHLSGQTGANRPTP